MPRLDACGVKWHVGSDDFALPGICTLAVEVFWTVVLVLLLVNKSDLECDSDTLLDVFLIGLTVVVGLSVIADVLMVHFSMRGAVMDEDARKGIGSVLAVRLFLAVVELAWVIMGTVVSYAEEDASGCRTDDDGNDDYLTLMRVVVISAWVVFVGRVVHFFYAADCLGSTPFFHSHREQPDSVDGSKWSLRLRILCCCVSRDDSLPELFKVLGDVFDTVFGGYHLVATDYAAGLALVHRYQTDKRRRLAVQTGCDPGSRYLHPGKTKPLTGEADAVFLEDCIHFAKYALAAYGWMLLTYDRCGTCCCRMLCQCSPRCLCQGKPDKTDCCGCYQGAIQATIESGPEELLFCQTNNALSYSPFFVAADHEKQTIVVSVRGTLSINDAVTDALVTPVSFDLPGYGETNTHSGMLRNSRQIMNRLQGKGGMLERAFERFPSYKLLIVGHSLGAGVATLLSCLLREEYPELRCIAYSPPGCMLEEEPARFTESFLTSVVVGHDFIPRMSMNSLLKLRKDILWALKSSTESKCSILSGCNCRGVPKNWWDHPAPLPQLACQLRDPSLMTPVFPAGRIVHFVKQETRPKWCCFGKNRKYVPVWIDRSAMCEITLTGRMAWDHFPNYVRDILTSITPAEIEVVRRGTCDTYHFEDTCVSVV